MSDSSRGAPLRASGGRGTVRSRCAARLPPSSPPPFATALAVTLPAGAQSYSDPGTGYGAEAGYASGRDAESGSATGGVHARLRLTGGIGLEVSAGIPARLVRRRRRARPHGRSDPGRGVLPRVLPPQRAGTALRPRRRRLHVGEAEGRRTERGYVLPGREPLRAPRRSGCGREDELPDIRLPRRTLRLSRRRSGQDCFPSSRRPTTSASRRASTSTSRRRPARGRSRAGRTPPGRRFRPTARLRPACPRDPPPVPTGRPRNRRSRPARRRASSP